MVRQGALEKHPVSEHRWIYDINDLTRMHGKNGILAEMGGVQGLAAATRTDIRAGLFHDEVSEGDFAVRRAKFGENKFEKPPLNSIWAHMWEALQDPMLIVLIIAGVISVIVGAIEDPGHGWYEGLAVLVAVMCVTAVASSNNWSQERAFRRLDDETKKPTALVLRDGKEIQIEQDEIVVGDVVIINAGAAIPADGVLISDDPIKVNESKMTGESRDIEKDFNNPFLYGGTEVREGQAVMLVVGVGPNSAYGRIMSALAQPQVKTPLQEKLEDIASLIGYLGGGVAVVLFVVLVAFFIGRLVKNDLSFKDEGSKLIDFFIIAVTVIVVAVPEGLPLAVTISLAYSMKKMLQDRNLVRVLSACETMGNATTICSDKTGTLTQNRMKVVKCWLQGRFWSEELPARNQLSENTMELLMGALVVNSQAFLTADDLLANERADPEDRKEWEDMSWKEGNQTEVGLLSWIMRFNVNLAKEKSERVFEKMYPFDSNKKRSSVILNLAKEHDAPAYRRYYKGAAERILADCQFIVNADGNVVPLQGELRETVMGTIDGMTRNGLRTIAFGYVDLPGLDRNDEGAIVTPPDSDSMVFVGCVGIKDPLRPESRRAVWQCQRAGIVVRMVTGDHLETAKHIAAECGILTDKDQIAMTGEDFRRMVNANQEDELLRVIPRLRVLARSEPDDKKALVEWLKRHDQVVAVTGDGTNDAPALKAAHVGFAMDKAGTEVAKSAADIRILDDNFDSIVESVKWGRSVFDNIRKFVQFQLTINLVALSLTLIGAIGDSIRTVNDGNTDDDVEAQTPLKAVQLLWVNLIMDTLAALALGTEVPTYKLLNRRPFKRDSSLISPLMWRNIFGQFFLQIAILLMQLYSAPDFMPDSKYGGKLKQDGVEHYTLIFNTFVFMQVFNEVNARSVSEDRNVFAGLHTNKVFAVVMFFTLGMQIMMVELFGSFAETTGLTWDYWLISIGFGALSLPWGAIVRMVPVNYEHGMTDPDPNDFKGVDFNDPVLLAAVEQKQKESAARFGASAVKVFNVHDKSDHTSSDVQLEEIKTDRLR